MNSLSIGTSSIRAVDSLYSLNDLHKAAGNEPKHKPVEFLRAEPTKALMVELERVGNSHLYLKTTKGRNGSTFVCKELVYAYAMWISAAFMLQVIRAYDAIKTGGYTVHPHQSLAADEADMLRKLITQHAESLAKDRQAAFIIKGWAKLKSHFGCSYRDIPRDKFTEAVSLLGRHMLEHRAEPVASSLPAEWAETFQTLMRIPASERRGLRGYINGYCYAFANISNTTNEPYKHLT
jgi:hypothetical protein